MLSPFRGGGIAYLSDTDSYAGWSIYTPVRATQARQVEGKVQHSFYFSLLSYYFPTLLSYYSPLLFLLFLCFTRPYITYLR